MESDLIQFYKDKKEGMPKSAALKLYGEKLGKDFIEEEYGEKQKAEFELRQPYVEKLLTEQTELLKSLNEKIENLKFPEYPEFPETIKIEKPDWWKEPQVIVKPPEVEVKVPEVKVPEIKIPEIKIPKTEVDLRALGELQQTISQALLTPKKEPQPVVLVDPERKTMYRAEMTAVARAPEEIKLKDKTGNLINPTTEDGNLAKIPGLAIPIHDYIGLTYTGSNLTEVVYKQGGASGTVVATLTLSYDVSGNLISVTKT